MGFRTEIWQGFRIGNLAEFSYGDAMRAVREPCEISLQKPCENDKKALSSVEYECLALKKISHSFRNQP